MIVLLGFPPVFGKGCLLGGFDKLNHRAWVVAIVETRDRRRRRKQAE